MLEMMVRDAREEEKGYLKYMAEGYKRILDENFFKLSNKCLKEGYKPTQEEYRNHDRYIRMIEDAESEYDNKLDGFGHSYENGNYVYLTKIGNWSDYAYDIK